MTQTGFNTTTMYGTSAQTGITGMYGQTGTGGSYNTLQTGETGTPGPVELPSIAGLPNYPTAGGNPPAQSGVGARFVTPMGNYSSGGFGAGGGFGASGGQPGFGGYRPQINPMGGYGARGGEGGSQIPPGVVPNYKSLEVDYIWEATEGLGQGGVNIINGLQDSIIGLANIPAGFVNGISWLEEKMGILDETKPVRVPYILSPDWSKGLIFDEGDSSHNASKVIGAAGVELLGGVWINKIRLLSIAVPSSGRWIGSKISAEATETAYLQMIARMRGLKAGGFNAIDDVRAFGSRGGSAFRGRGPLASSDLDLAVKDFSGLKGGRHYDSIKAKLKSIADDFFKETGIRVDIQLKSNYNPIEWMEKIGF
jgi:hypothetical protein